MADVNDPYDPARIKELYVSVRSFYSGRKYRPSPRWDGCDTAHSRGSGRSQWVRLAEALRAKQIDPVAYLSFSFSSVFGGRWPMPNQLASDKMIERFLESSQERLRRDTLEVRSQVQRFWAFAYPLLEAGVPVREVLAAAFAKTDLKISPLVRYCLSRQFDQHDLAAQDREAAVSQLRSQPQVLSALYGIVPDDLKEGD